MASSKCIVQKLIAWFAIIVSVLMVNLSGYGVSSVFITSLVFVVSTIIFIFSKEIEEVVEREVKNHICNEKQDSSLPDQVCQTEQEVPAGNEEECLSQAEKSSHVEEPKTETISKEKLLQHDLSGNHQIHGYLVGSSSHHDLYSESESIDPSFSSEDSDNDWTNSCNFGQSPECSDDSISDEESLIEIEIPSGHYVCPKEEPKLPLQYEFQNYSTETFLDEHNMLDQYAKINEMNEEDNLIEIDLSMGSIKCSSFELDT